MLDEKTLRKNITELFNAGWTNIRIADTLSVAGSFGDEFSRSEILEIADEIVTDMNREIVRKNRESQALLNECIDEVLVKNSYLDKHFKRTKNGVEFR